MMDHVITNACVVYAANNANSLEKIQTRVKFRLQLTNDLASPAIHLRKVPGRSPAQCHIWKAFSILDIYVLELVSRCITRE